MREEKTIDTLFQDIMDKNPIMGFNKEKNLSDELKSYCDEYQQLMVDLKPQMVKLSILETLILQYRSKNKIKESVVFFIVNKNYIYARIPFYRIDKNINDIRVIVGKTEFYGDDVDSLKNNNEIMNIAINKINKSIDKHIQITKNSL